jgi:hypothetical protein
MASPVVSQSIARTLLVGLFSGALGGILMLLFAVLLRWLLGLPTATELIFDRAFPLISIVPGLYGEKNPKWLT